MTLYQTARRNNDETNVFHAFLAAKAPGKPPEVPMREYVDDIVDLDSEEDIIDLMGGDLVLYKGEARLSGIRVGQLAQRGVQQH